MIFQSGCNGVLDINKLNIADQGYVLCRISDIETTNILVKIDVNDSRNYNILAQFDVYTGTGAKISPNDSLICFLAKPYSGDDAAVAIGAYGSNNFNLIDPPVFGHKLDWNNSGDRLYIEYGPPYYPSVMYISLQDSQRHLLLNGEYLQLIKIISDSLILVQWGMSLAYMDANGNTPQLITNQFQYPNLSPKPFERESIQTGHPFYQDFIDNRLLGTTGWTENGKTYSSVIETDIDGTYFKYLVKQLDYCDYVIWGRNGNTVFFQARINGYDWVYKLDVRSGKISPLLDFDLFPDYKYLNAYEFRQE